MTDHQRQILYEFDQLVKESEKYTSKYLDVFTDCFKLVEPKELLNERKKEFDYRVTKMLEKNGYKNLGIRSELDRIWKTMNVPTQGFGKYTRPLTLVGLNISDNTVQAKIVIWENYTEKVKDIILDLTEQPIH